ncbi:MAG: ATP-binding protein [Candidatus Dojkabacteria bacterium]
MNTKEIQEKIIESESSFRRLFETSTDGILIIEASSGKVLAINRFIEKFLDLPMNIVVGKKIWEISSFQDIVHSKKEFDELIIKRSIQPEDLQLQNKNKEVLNVEFNSHIYDVDGKETVEFNIRDNSIRKAAEAAINIQNIKFKNLSKKQEDTKKAMINIVDDLEEAKTKIEKEKIQAEAMLASIGDGVVVTDSESRVILINKSAERMLHCKSSDVVGKKNIEVWDIETKEGQAILPNEHPIQLVLSSTKNIIINCVYNFIRKDQTKFPVALTVTPVIIDGKILGAIDVFRDITKESEIDKMKTEFVSIASHQLRTPLGITKWYLEALQEQDYIKNAPKTTCDYLEIISKNNKRVISLVGDLLSISRIDQGRIKNYPKPTNIVDLIQEIYNEMSVPALKKKIEFNLEIKNKNLPSINIDPKRLYEVIENLVTNALEYTPSKGYVTISVDRAKDMILVSVKDNGIGISEKDQSKLFTKFFRTDKSIISNPQGSGLGLYLVKSYVENWRGNVEVKSKLGKGSKFSFTLPIKNK